MTQTLTTPDPSFPSRGSGNTELIEALKRRGLTRPDNSAGADPSEITLDSPFLPSFYPHSLLAVPAPTRYYNQRISFLFVTVFVTYPPFPPIYLSTSFDYGN